MRVKGTSSQERMRLLTSESLESLEQFLRDKGSTKSFCNLLVVTKKILATSKNAIKKCLHGKLPSGSINTTFHIERSNFLLFDCRGSTKLLSLRDSGCSRKSGLAESRSSV